MAQIIDAQLEQVKRSTPHPADVWQGGIFRMPAWITGEKRPPYRAMIPLWISTESGKAFSSDLLHPEEADPARLLEAFARAVGRRDRAGYRPGKLEVKDPDVAAYLRDHLAGLDIEVSETGDLDQVDGFLRVMAMEAGGPLLASGTLDGEGVTRDRMRALAEAAAAYYRARPWHDLIDEDLIRIESPVPEPALSHFVVMGAAGASYGLAFFSSAMDFDALHMTDEPLDWMRRKVAWHLDLVPIHDLPFGDADLWEDHDFPVAGPNAHPHVYCQEGGVSFRQPDAGTLAFLEGLLRAMSETTEDELDSGRWTRKVTTFDGPTEVTLALPDVLEPPAPAARIGPSGFPDRRLMEKAMRAMNQLVQRKGLDDPEEITEFLNREMVGGKPPEFKARKKRDKALALFYEALEARGRGQIKLARQALAIDPDCVDAHVLLAERSPDPERSLDHFRTGMAAGERAIGKKTFKEFAGDFHMNMETRPYLRALAGVATCLTALGRVDEALDHYRELLRLNRDDNQGVRFTLVPLLLERDEDEEAERILADYVEDSSAGLQYSRALLAFRKEGDSPATRKVRDAAIRGNAHLAKFILGKQKLPDESPEGYRLGSKDEAIIYAPALMPAWTRTPGALEWLGNRRRDQKKAKAEKKKGRPGKKKR